MKHIILLFLVLTLSVSCTKDNVEPTAAIQAASSVTYHVDGDNYDAIFTIANGKSALFTDVSGSLTVPYSWTTDNTARLVMQIHGDQQVYASISRDGVVIKEYKGLAQDGKSLLLLE